MINRALVSPSHHNVTRREPGHQPTPGHQGWHWPPPHHIGGDIAWGTHDAPRRYHHTMGSDQAFTEQSSLSRVDLPKQKHECFVKACSLTMPNDQHRTQGLTCDDPHDAPLTMFQSWRSPPSAQSTTTTRWTPWRRGGASPTWRWSMLQTATITTVRWFVMKCGRCEISNR